MPLNARCSVWVVACVCWVASVVSDSEWPHRRQPTRLPSPWDSPGKNTGVGCHFLLQCMKVKSEREVAQSCPTLRDPTDCSPSGSSVHGICQARVLECHCLLPRTSWEHPIVTINPGGEKAKSVETQMLSCLKENYRILEKTESYLVNFIQIAIRGFPGGSVVKNTPANAGDLVLIPDLGRSHKPWSN